MVSGQPPIFTVIDPQPAVSHPYLCLAYTLLLEEIHFRRSRAAAVHADAYAAIEPIEAPILRAAMIVRAVLMLRSFVSNQRYIDNLVVAVARESDAFIASSSDRAWA